jgi:hypothetical protein
LAVFDIVEHFCTMFPLINSCDMLSLISLNVNEHALESSLSSISWL